ncbi:ankyrin repeat domain-containing protein [archaeon]|nr:MAG: ankyrin repeat domain-containing protein [archaeon]
MSSCARGIADKGVDFKTNQFLNRYDALYYVVVRASPDVASVLLESGCCNVNARSPVEVDGNMTLLHLAAKSGNERMVATLLGAGASPAAVDDALYTPLHYAAQEGHRVIVRMLVEAGAPLHARTRRRWHGLLPGRTPHTLAALHGQSHVVMYFRSLRSAWWHFGGSSQRRDAAPRMTQRP